MHAVVGVVQRVIGGLEHHVEACSHLGISHSLWCVEHRIARVGESGATQDGLLVENGHVSRLDVGRDGPEEVVVVVRAVAVVAALDNAGVHEDVTDHHEVDVRGRTGLASRGAVTGRVFGLGLALCRGCGFV